MAKTTENDQREGAIRKAMQSEISDRDQAVKRKVSGVLQCGKDAQLGCAGRTSTVQVIQAILRAKRPTFTVQVLLLRHGRSGCIQVAVLGSGFNRRSWDIRAEVERREMAHNQRNQCFLARESLGEREYGMVAHWLVLS